MEIGKMLAEVLRSAIKKPATTKYPAKKLDQQIEQVSGALRSNFKK